MKQLIGIIAVILVLLGIWMVVGGDEDGLESEYEQTARTWMTEESPTYTGRNGDNLEMNSSEKVNDSAFRFEFTFEASEAGYGEPSSGEMSAQVITEHETVVTVEEGEVTEAVTDGVFDEIRSRLINEQEDVVDSRDVSLYFYDEKSDTDQDGNVLCSEEAVVPAERSIAEYTIEKHINLLLDGPTESEVSDGLSSEFPLEGLTLESADLDDNGTLTLTFSDPQNQTVGGSCRVGLLYSQIRKTAESIERVSEVVIEPEELFQP
ncbi:MAG: GerMN domain-containing protein [Candidatus Campbellbacteria bacterium]|nr:GerMN domain-containing protein [Candidatus Campbellbacteria bacterium]